MTMEAPRERTELAQREAIQTLRGDATASVAISGATPYAGLVTRTVALAIDALIVNGSAALVAVTIGLGLSLLHLPHQAAVVLAAIGGFLWILWSIGYFVFFWSTTGQTLGSRVMAITVIDPGNRRPLKPRRALLRFVALCIGAAALLSGIVIMLWDGRRRCFHDHVARTVVVYVPITGRV
jgi:uncharacterized RDD family membrane protein YckC